MDDKGKVVDVKDPAQSPEVGLQGHLLDVDVDHRLNLVAATYLPSAKLYSDGCKLSLIHI